MKKTLLAAATLSALMASGMANAAFTDADGSGGWTDSLEFNGTITNTNPAWKYQIPEATIAGAKNWNVKRSDGTVDGSNTNFSFTDKNFTVLEGVMKAPAPTGGAGLQPVVTFGNGDNTVVWDTTGTGLATSKSLYLPAKDGSKVVGNLTLQLQGQAASVRVMAGNNRAIDLSYNNVINAYKLIQGQPYWATTYEGLTQSSHPTESAGIGNASTSHLARRDMNTMAAALVAMASEFKLTVPTASIPNEWTATLPISITVK